MTMIVDSAERLRLRRRMLQSTRVIGSSARLQPSQAIRASWILRARSTCAARSSSYESALEELKHRANMKTGGITASDKRDFGLDLRFTHKKEQFFDA